MLKLKTHSGFHDLLQVKKKIDRRVEPPDTFLEENHPMTISSNFVLIEQMVSDKKIFMGISHRVYVKLSSAVVAILVGVLK
jgi:hypothetical protein